MERSLVIGAGFILIVAALATGQTSSKWGTARSHVRAGKASYHEVVDTCSRRTGSSPETEEKWLNVRPARPQRWLLEGALSAKARARGLGFLEERSGGDASTRRRGIDGRKGVYREEYARSKGYDYSVVGWIEQNQPTAREIDAFTQSGSGR